MGLAAQQTLVAQHKLMANLVSFHLFRKGIQPQGWKTGEHYCVQRHFAYKADRSIGNLVSYSGNTLPTLGLNASNGGFPLLPKGVKRQPVWYNRHQPSFARLWQEGFSLRVLYGATFGWQLATTQITPFRNWTVAIYFFYFSQTGP